MAEADDLVGQVQDAELRRALAAAVKDLKRRQNFGLVFEKHIPELATIPGAPVEPGDLVRIRKQSGDGVHRVLAVSGSTGVVEAVDGTGRTERPIDELVLIKRLGEAVYPILQPIGSIERASGKPYHAVINGENYHALQLSLYLYEGRVDCIYIDPPYNTGARDWKYNNRFVDSNDLWAHSKWLAMMDKRLRLAKRLLKPDGVLICTVDEHEVHHLAMLLEDLFRDYYRYMVTIVHNPKGTYKDNFARVEEYAIFCCPKSDETINPLPEGLFTQAKEPSELEQALSEGHEDLYLRRRGQESGYRHQRPNQFYAILVDEARHIIVGVGPALGADEPYDIKRDGNVVTVYPIDTRRKDRVWRYGRETMQRLIEAGEIVVTGYSERTPQGWVLNHRKPKRTTKRIKTVWWEKRHDAGTHGSDLLTEYLGRPGLFPFPKSVYAVRDCLDAVVRNRPDALIVDFFAGSGTTLHSVCLLNLVDEGRRRCVLVTNNEVEESAAKALNSAGHYPGDAEYEKHGIFEAVTRPRVEAVLTGRRPDGEPVRGEHVWAGRRSYARGFDENVEFYQMRYVDPDEIELGRAFGTMLPLFWLRAGAIGSRPKVPCDGAMLVSEDAPIAILFDEAHARRFAQTLAKRPDIRHAFIVTDSADAFAEIRGLVGAGREVSMLYRDYLRTFDMRTRS
jgi:adenine-specific DNA-methyltransferase